MLCQSKPYRASFSAGEKLFCILSEQWEGGCIYPWFFDMTAGGRLILETLDTWYRSMNIRDFMKKSYEYCLEHEAEIRNHMNRAEEAGI